MADEIKPAKECVAELPNGFDRVVPIAALREALARQPNSPLPSVAIPPELLGRLVSEAEEE